MNHGPEGTVLHRLFMSYRVIHVGKPLINAKLRIHRLDNPFELGAFGFGVSCEMVSIIQDSDANGLTSL